MGAGKGGVWSKDRRVSKAREAEKSLQKKVGGSPRPWEGGPHNRLDRPYLNARGGKKKHLERNGMNKGKERERGIDSQRVR